ncbi:MAG: DUF423 domain-containing protein [Pseudomonadota bacterium]
MTLARTSALFGFTCIVLGAFGAHGLELYLNEKELGWWETGTFYALSHAVAALALGLVSENKALHRGGWAMLFGVVVFSGTLYAMALGAPTWLGAITPIGGVSLLIGWALVFFASKDLKRQEPQQQS